MARLRQTARPFWRCSSLRLPDLRLCSRGLPLLHNLSPVDEVALTVAQDAIRASGPEPTDRLYVVNSAPWLNVATALAPPGPYFAWFHLICDFPGAGFEKLQDVMAGPASLRRGVRDRETATMRAGFALVAPQNASSKSYQAIGTATVPRDSFTIYQRR